MQAWFEKVGKMFEMAFISGDRWKLYLDGLGVTLQIAFFAAILGMVIGTVVALMKLSTRKNGKCNTRAPAKSRSTRRQCAVARLRYI